METSKQNINNKAKQRKCTHKNKGKFLFCSHKSFMQAFIFSDFCAYAHFIAETTLTNGATCIQ